MSWEIVAIAITIAAHFVGAVVLIYVALDGSELGWRDRRKPNPGNGGEDDDEDGGLGIRVEDHPVTPDGGFALPLPDADQSPRRLREPAPNRTGPLLPRRREHTPRPTRERPRTPVER